MVIIGKSFLSTGGQNPCEAIVAMRPVVFGPHMENFEPLASRLAASGGCIRAADQTVLAEAITTALDPKNAATLTRNAASLLAGHQGATSRILALLAATESQA